MRTQDEIAAKVRKTSKEFMNFTPEVLIGGDPCIPGCNGCGVGPEDDVAGVVAIVEVGQ